MSYDKPGRARKASQDATEESGYSTEPEHGITEIRVKRAPGAAGWAEVWSGVKDILREWFKGLSDRLREMVPMRSRLPELLVSKLDSVQQNMPTTAGNRPVHSMKLQVKPSPTVDREQLLVRINAADKPADIGWYDYIHLINKANSMKIVCKLHGDDIPEIKNRKRGLLYINEPLRVKIGTERGKTMEFAVSKAYRRMIWYYFVRYHPNDTVRVGTWLGIIAVGIGVVSLLLAIIAVTR